MMWRGSRQSCSSLCHSTEADKRENVQSQQNTRPADRPIVLSRTTPASWLKQTLASMPIRHEELDMKHSNFSLLNRRKKQDFVTGLLLVATVTIAGLAFMLPVLTVLIWSVSR